MSTASRSLSQEAEPQQHFVCHICHFLALNSTGLLQHLFVSHHCSQMSGPFIPPTPDKPVDSSLPIDLDYDYTDKFNNQNCMADEDLTSIEGVVADGFDTSIFQNRFPDCVPFSHSHENNNDQDNDDDDNLVCQIHSSNQISTSNLLGCNKHYKYNGYTSNPQSK
jgi:hypothetical protein